MLRILFEHEDPDLTERIWAFRHLRFVEQLGWEELRRQDHRERDRFDTPSVVHAVLALHGEVIGYSRLVPTIAPNFAAEVAGALGIDLPKGPQVYEWTRCATALDAPSIAGVDASDLLMTGVLECLLHLGARQILFVTYTPLVAMMRRRGYLVRPLASLPLERDRPVTLASADISTDLLHLHRKTYGVCGTLLSWSGPHGSIAGRSPAAA
ncbi:MULTISPECIES: acyl-homoserine-lactone synthase [Rhizobium]|uniref:Autoinducer synthesis protein n=1 Tax=Rhizobium favelukesii TaxID=348824 RepID=W6RQQ8_9HYPH|nr:MULTISPECIES: acyl-homoserine-lactone synthase [Rhizobium]MCA0806696.1 N-acyl-L-homoserine lactone synthetase [Rhizobium sp. T1473]MCS0462403.1 N-acyl-L-homoserine lactone synthetase [Rhizobium favelukesii]UFS85208.1 N-acyl-L-homoserine lactone synthetase [Rhizobium sp. T136]CDM61193.1 autoinducer synthesis protein [Rhizobium favelukesii]